MFRRKMSVTDWAAMLQKIKDNAPDLQILHLASCNLNDESVVALACALLKNTNVIKINLAGNIISDLGAKVLIKLLSKNDCIREINLSFNMVAIENLRRIQFMTEMNAAYVRPLRYSQFSEGVYTMPENKLMQSRPRNKP